MEASSYPVPKPHYTLHLTAKESVLYLAKRGGRDLPRSKMGFEAYGQWLLPEPLSRYLALCDGKTTHGEIARKLGGPVPFLGDLWAHELAKVLERETGVLEFRERPLEGPSPLVVTGGFDSFAPSHIAFEITETCNFRCEHCYVSASPEKHGRKNGAETIATLKVLADRGVRVVELTGGECTTHPEFREILQYASEAFYLVAIVTNGYLMGKRADLADLVASLPNVVVQVSIDGLREFHDQFRVMPGSFDAACEAIRRLRSRGVFVRAAMSVTQANVDQVDGVFRTVKELDVNALAVAPVTTFGRANDLGSCSEVEHELYHQITRALAPYADDPLFDALRHERAQATAQKDINCGAGWRTFALNSDGNVRSCLYLADSKKFGNLDVEDYDEVFRRKEMHMFRNAPSPGGEHCAGPQPDGSVGCKHLPVCNGCFAKAFRISETEYPDCPWRAAHFPGMSLGLDSPSPMVPVASLVRKPRSDRKVAVHSH